MENWASVRMLGGTKISASLATWEKTKEVGRWV